MDKPQPEADWERIERLAAEIHQVYCDYYRTIKGEEYWTKGDYYLLNDLTKEADRFMARFITRREERLRGALEECVEQLKFYDKTITIKNHDKELIKRASDALGERC